MVVASSRPDVEKAMSRPFTPAQAPASRPGEDVVSQWAAKARHRPLLRGSPLWVQSPASMRACRGRPGSTAAGWLELVPRPARSSPLHAEFLGLTAV